MEQQKKPRKPGSGGPGRGQGRKKKFGDMPTAAIGFRVPVDWVDDVKIVVNNELDRLSENANISGPKNENDK